MINKNPFFIRCINAHHLKYLYMIKTVFFMMAIMLVQSISSTSYYSINPQYPRGGMNGRYRPYNPHFGFDQSFKNDSFFNQRISEPTSPTNPSLPYYYNFPPHYYNRRWCRRQNNKPIRQPRRKPFPVNPTAKDLLQSPAGAPNVLVIAESTMSSFKYSREKKRVVISEYENTKDSEWSFEKITETEVVQYRIRHVVTGQYLVIAPNGQGFILTLRKETKKNYSRESLWEMVRQKNGSYSFVSVRKKLAITRSNKDITEVTMTPYLARPCQCFYLYDWNKCRNRYLGYSP